MARSEGSLCSKDAKEMAKEITTLTGISYKQNLDYLRFIEQLMVYRINEQIREHINSGDDKLSTVSVEIPLIGTLEIKPIVFHKSHRLTDKPSYHFEFDFEPLSGFKKHILDAYTDNECELPTMFAQLYGEKLANLYRGGEE